MGFYGICFSFNFAFAIGLYTACMPSIYCILVKWLEDLANANRLDPSNQTVERLLVKLRAERRVQREKDSKTFTGMFDRGQIYDKAA